MIVHSQVITRIIDGKDYSFIEDNHLTREKFPGYEEEYDFIIEYYQKYNVIPDDTTFQARFKEFEFVEVNTPDDALLDALDDVYASSQVQKFRTKLDELLSEQGGIEALNFLKNHATDVPDVNEKIQSHDIIEAVDNRVTHSQDVSQHISDWFIPTGFAELDADINGFQRGDELVVLFARTNQGKSWIAEKIASYMSEIGYKVGYFSPEMNELDIGYRFDTLHGHLSNNAMRLGRFDDEFSIDDYTNYAETVKKLTGKLYVTRPKDFARKVTVSKLKQWIKSDNLDALFIDGITYLTDERFKKGDSKTISLTNISEDLMDLSSEMRIPIIVIVQANRGGISEKGSTDTPELENIRDSDGIAQNASIVYAIKQLRTSDGDTFLIFDNKKMRGGEVGKSYKYRWKINTGEFEWVDDSEIPAEDKESENPVRNKKSPTSGRKRRSNKEAEDDY